MSTSEAPAMTQAAIRKLVADSVTIALEAQAANMANTDNTTRHSRVANCKDNVAKKVQGAANLQLQRYGLGAIGLIHKKKPLKLYLGGIILPHYGIEEAYKITWVKLQGRLRKDLLILSLSLFVAGFVGLRTEVQKMEDEFGLLRFSIGVGLVILKVVGAIGPPFYHLDCERE
ncbi:hypothetical protein Tco_1106184 [Tanacetum coccineum]